MQIEITFDNTPIIYEEDNIKYNPPTEYTTKNNPSTIYTPTTIL